MAEPVALVTGGTGFVGSHLVRHLARTGWQPHLLVRAGTDTEPIEELCPPTVLHRFDGRTARMLELVGELRPRVVFHLASLFLPSHGPDDVEPLLASNLLLGTQLAEAMGESGGGLLVNTGTAWQHYENRDYDPVCLYAATKQAFEAILRFYVECASLRVVTLKLHDTYGPGDRRKKLFFALREAARRGEALAMSPGDQLLDLVYIDDVIEAYRLAAERLLRGRVRGMEEYAVSSGQRITLRNVVATFERVAGRPLPIEWGGRPYRDREVMAPWSLGKPIPGWSAQTPLEEGLRRTLASAGDD